jgi:hypothetical protein
MHNIAQKQIFFKNLPELDPDLVVKFPDPQHWDPDFLFYPEGNCTCAATIPLPPI